MEPEQPPRRARQGSVPVTIDLSANPADEAAKGSPAEPVADSAEPADVTPPADESIAASDQVGNSQTQAEEKPDVRQTESPSAAAVPQPGPVSSRRFSGLLPGLVGGIVVLAGVAGLQVAGLWPQAGADPQLTAANQTLTSQVSELAQRLDALPKPDATLDQQMESRITAIETKLAEIPEATASDPARLAALTDEVAALKSALAKAEDDSAKARAALEMRLEATEKKISEPRDDVEVARAIASAGLKAAIDRGGPFMSELETLAQVIPDDPVVVELRNFAAVGVPSRADLMKEYPDAANLIMASLAETDPDQGIWDRLTASAWSLVKVRPVGNVEGEGPEAVVARIENKLQNGDLKGAALEFDSLPDAGKQAASAFKSRLDARMRVEELVGGALDRALGSTAKAG